MPSKAAFTTVVLHVALCIVIGCSDKQSREGNSGHAKKIETKSATPVGTGVLAGYDLDAKEPARIDLPPELREISGIALTPGGELFAHGDERAIIYQLDPATGAVIKRFQLGLVGVKDDFEDIAIVDSFFYLVTSRGDIYRFTEGEDDASVPFELFETRLSGEQDVEGLCYDPSTGSLLLACKGTPGKGMDGKKAVYSFSLDRMSLDEKPRFLLSVDELRRATGEEEFNPSAIARHPGSGDFLLLAAQGNGLVEIDAGGAIVGHARLRGKVHPQPEGLALASDLTLLISDEGKDGKGRITRYPLLH